MQNIRKNVFEKIEFVLFVLPVILLGLFAFYIPFIMGMFYSFTKWNGISKHPMFIGIKNFKDILGDTDFLDSCVFTLKYTIFFVLVINILSILIAIFLDKQLKTSNFLAKNGF